MRAVFRRRCLAFVAGRHKASVAAPLFHTVIGKPSFLSAVSRSRASLRRCFWTGRWTESASSPGSNRCWRQPCTQATSSSWTIWRHIRSPASGTLLACGAELQYLPPYSPDLNPIENAFAKLKAHMRGSAARTVDTLERAAANALPQFKPDECANFFAHAGYGFN
jgi:transposase